MNCYVVYITAGSADEARRIGAGLVEERLAACVNILGGVESTYRWEGKTETASEIGMVAKTTQNCLDALIKRVKDLHSYDCPCVVAMPITAGFEPFLNWIREETGNDQ